MIIDCNILQTYPEGFDFNCIHHALQKCYKYDKSYHNSLWRLSSLTDLKELSIRGWYSKQGRVLLLLLLFYYKNQI